MSSPCVSASHSSFLVLFCIVFLCPFFLSLLLSCSRWSFNQAKSPRLLFLVQNSTFPEMKIPCIALSRYSCCSVFFKLAFNQTKRKALSGPYATYFVISLCPRGKHRRMYVWSYGSTGSAVPSRVSPLILHTQAESGAYSRGSSRFPRWRPHNIPSTAIGSVPNLSGHAVAYRWCSPPRVH